MPRALAQYRTGVPRCQAVSPTTYYATHTSEYPISLDIPTKFLYASFFLRLSAHTYPEGPETRDGDMMVYEQGHVKKTDGSPPKQKLLDRARDIMRVKHDSMRTERSSINWMRRYIMSHDKRHPKDMGPREIEAFLTSRAVEGHAGKTGVGKTGVRVEWH